jgi:hypothetical protein
MESWEEPSLSPSFAPSVLRYLSGERAGATFAGIVPQRFGHERRFPVAALFCRKQISRRDGDQTVKCVRYIRHGSISGPSTS